MDISLDLFVNKVRVQVRYVDADNDTWTNPVLLTDAKIKEILEDPNVRQVNFVPLEGREYFTVLGVGNVKGALLDIK